MKRNNLTTAILAGITGVAGIASVSNAVNLNPDGIGQVLIYPYYTVRNNLTTLISVVNTTDQVKAVKVRFLEGKNSREVLDFNLYMSPYDVWTANVKKDPANAANGFLSTTDTSCLVPNYISATGQAFLEFAYSSPANALTDTNDVFEVTGQSGERRTEGHFEMIEMGNLIDPVDVNAATHVAGVGGAPASCATLQANWAIDTNNVAGKWVLNPNDGVAATSAGGGIFGSTTIVDVSAGMAYTYNADAVQSFTTSILHAFPGSLFPNITNGSIDGLTGAARSFVFNEGVSTATDWTQNPVQAVSAVYTHSNLYGEYAIGLGIQATTEWVLTFPTKSFYVDAKASVFLNLPMEPFASTYESANASFIGYCEEFGVPQLRDREENRRGTGVFTPPPIVPSPPEPIIPGQVGHAPSFCKETNVLEFAQVTDDAANTVLASGNVLGSENISTVNTTFGAGWMNLSFGQTTNVGKSPGGRNQIYTGLPVTGFAIQKYGNGPSTDPLAKRYGAIFKHRGTKSIVSI